MYVLEEQGETISPTQFNNINNKNMDSFRKGYHHETHHYNFFSLVLLIVADKSMGVGL